MKKTEIEKSYNLIKKYHEKFLKKHNIILPKLKRNGKYTKNALCLVYLAINYPKTKKVTKKELTKFIRRFHPDINDVQQARHLAAQSGWFIKSGTRGDMDSTLKPGEYKLITLKTHYPKFRHQKSEALNKDEWENIKSKYNHRCATCGSKENEENFRYKGTITKLQKGHKNPNKPLTPENTIPQCQKCNRPDRNYWIYNDNGRVVSIATPRVVLKSNKKMKKEIYELLKKEFGEK